LAGKPKASRGSKKQRRQNASSDSVPTFHWRRAGTALFAFFNRVADAFGVPSQNYLATGKMTP